MSALIKRDIYLNRLIAAKHNKFVKIITGIRRCGKSYLLFTLFRQHLLDSGVMPDHIIAIDLEQTEDDNLLNPILLKKYIQERIPNDGQWTYVLLDEIQTCDTVLRDGVNLDRLLPEDRDKAYITFYKTLSALRTMPNVDVYVTGSNSRMLSSDVATEFRGRGQEIRIHPLSISEFLPLREPIHDLHAVLREYLMYGGLPDCVLAPDDDSKAAYLEHLCKAIYLRDVEERNKIRNEPLLESLFDIVMSNIGGLTNPTKLANAITSVAKLPANNATVSKYLGFLCNAFLISKANRYDVRGRHYLDYPVKYYTEDTGLRNVQTKFRQYEPTHLMENAIYNELIRRGYAVDVGVVIASPVNAEGKQEKRQFEIDFVVNKASKRIYIQSAWAIPDEEKRKQEIFSLTHVGDSFHKIVVTGDPYEKPWTSEEGITFIGIVPFLTDPKSVETI